MAVNLVDRVIGWLDPAAGLKRHHQRRLLQRAYEAANPRDGWRPRRQGASANADHAADAAALRAKARALVQNVPYLASALRGLVSYTVGTGIVSRAVGRNADAFNQLFDQWRKVCDADGRLDWYGMQAAAYRAMEQDGEVLIRLRPRRPSDGLPIPLQLQLLEIDWLDSTRHGWIDGEDVVNGIAYDALGKPAAYYLWDRHPGDMSLARSLRTTSRRVPASSVIHLFAPERPGQGRGFSRFASVIARTRDLQLYEDAELARKNLETRLAVLASGDVSQMQDQPPGQVQDDAARTGEMGELAGGSIIQLPAGMQTTVVEPKVAPGYVEYVKQNLHVIAAGIGVPYALMVGDLSDTSFSSGRIGLLDFRRTVQSTQWLVLIPCLIERVVLAALDAAVLAGAVRAVERKLDHSTPKWEYVNPDQDVKAETAEIAAGLTTPSEAARRRGYTNFDAVVAEMQADFQKLEAAGVLPILLALQGRVMPGVAPGTGVRDEPPPRAEAPAVHIHQAPVTVQPAAVHVAPAAVRVEGSTINLPAAEVRVESPTVNVAPPEVHVDAPVVNVAPAEVRVEAPAVSVTTPAPVVNVTTPRRRVDGLVERDDKGRVLRTTQIETDLPDQP